MRLRLYSVKDGEHDLVHDVVRRIRARIDYLPELTSLSGSPLLPWLRVNLPARRRRAWPAAAATSACVARDARERAAHVLALSRGPLAAPRKVLVKEFLQAGDIAKRVLDDPSIRHLHGHFCHGATTITWFVSRLTGAALQLHGAREGHLPSGSEPAATCSHASSRPRASSRPARAPTRSTCGEHAGDRGRRAHDLPRARYRYFAPVRDDGKCADRGRSSSRSGASSRRRASPASSRPARACARAAWSCAAVIVGEHGPDYARIARMIREAGSKTASSCAAPSGRMRCARSIARRASSSCPARSSPTATATAFRTYSPRPWRAVSPSSPQTCPASPSWCTDGVDGLLVPARDPAALARQCTGLIEIRRCAADSASGARETICTSFDSSARRAPCATSSRARSQPARPAASHGGARGSLRTTAGSPSGARVATSFCAALGYLLRAELVAHFRARPHVRSFAVAEPEETRRDRIDAAARRPLRVQRRDVTSSPEPIDWLHNPSARRRVAHHAAQVLLRGRPRACLSRRRRRTLPALLGRARLFLDRADAAGIHRERRDGPAHPELDLRIPHLRRASARRGLPEAFLTPFLASHRRAGALSLRAPRARSATIARSRCTRSSSPASSSPSCAARRSGGASRSTELVATSSATCSPTACTASIHRLPPHRPAQLSLRSAPRALNDIAVPPAWTR